MNIYTQHNYQITQIDYIKSLIENQRLGEALEYINQLESNLKIYCEHLAQEISTSEVTFQPKQLQIKVNNHVLVNGIWCKILHKDSNSIELEIMKNLSVIKEIKKSKINSHESNYV